MMIGQLISHYKILAKLGEGGMGVVYKAQDTKLDRLVALKFLPQHLSASEQDKARFIQEAKAAATLNHPNICDIHEIDESPDGQLYIVMAFYEGTPLNKKIEHGPLKVDEALDVTIQAAEGLQAAHKKGIVHRDIKSSNIMITTDGQVKIMDFGLAKSTAATMMTKTGATVGTVPYMSPEQARGEKVDHRTDIWSLGVVLYEIATGHLPFQSPYSEAIIYSILNEEPKQLTDLRSDVPAELERIVKKAMAKNRNDRYSSADEMFRDLKICQDSSSAEEMGAMTLRTVFRQLRRPRIAISSIGLLVVIFAAAAWFFDRQAKIRWAREEALPEITRLVKENDVWRDLTSAYRLAQKAEEFIPDDPKLTELFSKCALNINIRTEPPGANIYMKVYKTPDAEWEYLGVTPIENTRVPIGIFRWKMEKEGYETVLAAASTWAASITKSDIIIPYDLVRILDEEGTIPPGMVRIPGWETPVGKADEFYIDKYEVTNRQFKQFIDGGGYRKREYWIHKFFKERRELTWEEAIAGFLDQTGRPGPSAWYAGDYPEGQDDFPVSGVSWYEAAAYAEYAGKSLPTRRHWSRARGEGTPLIRVPQLGGFAVLAPFSNFSTKGPVAVGSLAGITAYGAFDMAGNVREWCWNETPEGRVISGGAWDDNTYMFSRPSQAPPMDRSSKNGFRCALYPNPEKISESVFQMVAFPRSVDFYKDEPVADAIFQVYREQFSYDKTDLKAQVESREESSEGWIKEKITFDAAYGGERIIAYLFLPKNVAPPYQTVIYFPGAAVVAQRSSKEIESYYEFPLFLSFIVKNGRAALFPVYKGTFERGDMVLAPIHSGANSRLYTEYLIQLVKDFKRCIDYLENREDIDSKKLAYYGMSWGGLLGAIIPAVEDRLQASFLLGASLTGIGRPEANQINYITRVKTPTLMLNGRYDTISPFETSIKPMFDLLGTPAEHKELKLYDTDHIPPRNEFIKETLAWLDRYLGSVR